MTYSITHDQFVQNVPEEDNTDSFAEDPKTFDENFNQTFQKNPRVGFPTIRKSPPIKSIIFALSMLFIGMYLLDNLYDERTKLITKSQQTLSESSSITMNESLPIIFQQNDTLWYKKDGTKAGIPDTSNVTHFTFSAKNNSLLYARAGDDTGDSVYLYRITGNQSIKILPKEDAPISVRSLALAPDNSYAATLTNEQLFLYSNTTHEVKVYAVQGENGNILISPDAKRIVYQSKDTLNSFTLFTLENEQVREINLPELGETEIVGWLNQSTLVLNQYGNQNGEGNQFENRLILFHIESETIGNTIKTFQNTLFVSKISGNYLYAASRESSLSTQIRLAKYDLSKSTYDETFIGLLDENVYVGKMVDDGEGGIYIETYTEDEGSEKILYISPSSFEIKEVEAKAIL